MPQIALSQIKLDQRAQPRAALNTDLTAEYADAMKAGAQFPPLTVFHDGKAYWLADGFHRHYAATSIGARDIACIVKSGGLRDAILHSCQVNSAHGLRRSDEDKRRAVKVLLADHEWASWSDREIARRCQVSHEFVRKLRPLTVNVDSEEPQNSGKVAAGDRTFRSKHGSISTMTTAAIGRGNRTIVAGEKRGPTASQPSTLDAPASHAAITVLARSICDVRASAEEIVAACTDHEERSDLCEACEGAAARLSGIISALKAEERRKAA